MVVDDKQEVVQTESDVVVVVLMHEMGMVLENFGHESLVQKKTYVLSGCYLFPHSLALYMHQSYHAPMAHLKMTQNGGRKLPPILLLADMVDVAPDQIQTVL
jgi:hypothetical protein